MKSAEIIHIVLAFNDTYAPYAMVLLASILRQSQSKFEFHVLSCGLSCKWCDVIYELVKKFNNANVNFINHISFNIEVQRNNSRISDETYLRLVACDLLPQLHKVLYLDVDLLIRGDITKIFAHSIKNDCAICGVIEEQMSHNGYPESVGMCSGVSYVNAGVLLMNFDIIRQRGGGKVLLEMCHRNGRKFRFMDQDVLNMAFQDCIDFMPMEFNYNLYYYRKYKKYRHKALIIHFTGAHKPWDKKGANRWPNRLWRRDAVFVHLLSKKFPIWISMCFSWIWYLCDYVVGFVFKNQR